MDKKNGRVWAHAPTARTPSGVKKGTPGVPSSLHMIRRLLRPLLGGIEQLVGVPGLEAFLLQDFVEGDHR